MVIAKSIIEYEQSIKVFICDNEMSKKTIQMVLI